MFIYRRNKACILLLVYVDDILVTCNDPKLISKAISDLNKAFTLKILGSISFFPDFEATRDHTGMSLTQQKYMREVITKMSMLQANSSPTPMCPSHKLNKEDAELLDQPSLCRSTVGSL